MRTSLAPPPGVISDDTDFSTQGWTDTSGARFRLGRLETVGGFESLSLTALTGVCRTAYSWSDMDGLLSFAFGCHNNLTVWQAGDQAVVTPTAFVTGQIDGTGGSGYGTGAYGIGDYGEPSTDDNFPLTWSFGSRYGKLYANPRGQGVFVWENDTSDIAIPLTGAPAVANYILTTWTGQIMAFGCTTTGAVFNASCVRICDSEDPEDWTPGTASTSQQYFLDGGGRIVGAQAIGQSVYIWTTAELHVAQWTGSEWSFSRVGKGGLCGPNAAIVSGQTAYWIGPDLQLYYCALGGAPQILTCPIRTDFEQNAAASQNDKIVAASVSQFGEIIFLYADARDGYEISRALRFSTVDGAWAPDVLARTAFVDASPSPSPVGVTYAGQIYWHERGNSADGAALSWFAETGWQYIEPGERHVMVLEWRPDIKDQIGPITLTVTTRRYPQDDDVTQIVVVSPNQTKVDLRISGLLAKFRFEGSSSPSFARFGKQTFDFALAGPR